MRSLGVTGEIALSLGKTVAQVIADFSPVPGLAPAVELLCGIIELCEEISINKSSAKQLRDRCHGLLSALKETTKDAPNSMQDAIEGTTDCLLDVKIKMNGWTMLSRMDGLLRHKEINRDIEHCHEEVSDCMTRFQLRSHVGIHRWQDAFTINTQNDHAELVRYLSDIKETSDLTNVAVLNNAAMLRQMMQMMQLTMAENRDTADRVHNGLSINLYRLQEASGELLPNLRLQSGEVRRIGQFPVKGTAAMDIYEGLYLQHKKVAVKVVRAVHANDKSLRRFMREVQIWTKVWQVDGGKHILPFYGFGQNDDEPYPFMVTPWPENGDALAYVKSKDLQAYTYMSMIRDIGEGIKVLHSMQPAVVHGDIKACNVAIDAQGRALLADFGLSQIVEDITGVPFTQSRGIADSYRWFAPEVCVGEGMLSQTSDIYAYGMTTLELLTHQQPYREVKHTTEVVILSSSGKFPKRPQESQVIARGLNDDVWMIMNACWSKVPNDRPSIEDLLVALPAAQCF